MGKDGVLVALRDSATVWGCRRKASKRKSYLLRRMKGRMEQRGRDGVTMRTSLKSSKSSRELKKLEWTVSYKKAKMGSSTGFSRGASGSGCK